MWTQFLIIWGSQRTAFSDFDPVNYANKNLKRVWISSSGVRKKYVYMRNLNNGPIFQLGGQTLRSNSCNKGLTVCKLNHAIHGSLQYEKLVLKFDCNQLLTFLEWRQVQSLALVNFMCEIARFLLLNALCSICNIL